MYKLIRLYNQNRKKILLILLIIVFFSLIFSIINKYFSLKYDYSNRYNYRAERHSNISNAVTSYESLLTGSDVNKSKLENDTEVIDIFLKYCKQNDIENAYNLVSTACKEQLYPNINIFKEKYLNIMFTSTEFLYKIENWEESIYKIVITENILSTGKEADISKQDYITVVKENGMEKLNINGLVREINKNYEREIDNFKIKITKEFQYMDYTIFVLEFINSTGGKVLIDKLEDISGIYLQDNKGLKYNLYSHEMTKNDFLIKPNETIKLNLKFYGQYRSNKYINKLTFNDIIFYYMDDTRQYSKQCSLAL